jgi:zinc protease
VGSMDETNGTTGVAHVLEHMMFKGTKTVPPGEFSRIIAAAGGRDNAFTSRDYTGYFQTLHKSQLGLALKLEADRMSQLALTADEFAKEIRVVMEERRWRTDDRPRSLVYEQLMAAALKAHPYRHPIIGWMSDLQNMRVQDAQAFYDRWYAPNNATLVIVGDVEPERVLSTVQSAYGAYAAAKIPDAALAPEPLQNGERRSEVAKLTPTWKLNVGYKSPALGDPDHLPLSVLSEVLFGGRSSRLVKTLLRDRELASDVRASVAPLHDAGLFEIFVSAREGVNATQLLEVVDEELDRVQSEPVTDEEIARARARIELGLLQGLATNEGKASTIGFYEVVLGNPGWAFERLTALGDVNAATVLRVARRYLNRASRTVLLVQPQLSGSAEESSEGSEV